MITNCSGQRRRGARRSWQGGKGSQVETGRRACFSRACGHAGYVAFRSGEALLAKYLSPGYAGDHRAYPLMEEDREAGLLGNQRRCKQGRGRQSGRPARRLLYRGAPSSARHVDRGLAFSKRQVWELGKWRFCFALSP